MKVKNRTPEESTHTSQKQIIKKQKKQKSQKHKNQTQKKITKHKKCVSCVKV